MHYSKALLFLLSAVSTVSSVAVPHSSGAGLDLGKKSVDQPDGYVGAGGVAILNRREDSVSQPDGYVGAGGVQILNRGQDSVDQPDGYVGAGGVQILNRHV
ncbi:hypothetical protein N431DRAFT_462222 [Stipitochalara longipes BDJ]|nr:hypothetical protein N431DRAFT_462222 [Stipitochalara longipes BDJ]